MAMTSDLIANLVVSLSKRVPACSGELTRVGLFSRKLFNSRKYAQSPLRARCYMQKGWAYFRKTTLFHNIPCVYSFMSTFSTQVKLMHSSKVQAHLWALPSLFAWPLFYLFILLNKIFVRGPMSLLYLHVFCTSNNWSFFIHFTYVSDLDTWASAYAYNTCNNIFTYVHTRLCTMLVSFAAMKTDPWTQSQSTYLMHIFMHTPML